MTKIIRAVTVIYGVGAGVVDLVELFSWMAICQALSETDVMNT